MPALAYRSTLPRPDDPDILNTIATEVAQGVPMRYAALAAGISESTAYHWAIAGRQALENADNSRPVEELGSHAVFMQTVKEAEAQCVRDGIARWRSAEKDWAKWPTLLERRFPDDFSRGPRPTAGTTVNVLVLGASGETKDQLLALLQERLSLPEHTETQST